MKKQQTVVTVTKKEKKPSNKTERSLARTEEIFILPTRDPVMSQRRTSRAQHSEAKKKYDKTRRMVTKDKGLSSDGYDFLVHALDPFHDRRMQYAGFPDRDTSQSVVRHFNQELVILPPPGITPDQTWDLHVFQLPLLADVNQGTANSWRYGALYNNSIIQDIAPYYADAAYDQFTGVVYVSVLSGQKTWDNPALSAVGVTQNIALNGSSNDTTFRNDRLANAFRYIGGGFEVVNRSPMITTSGEAICYAMPCTPTFTSTAIGTSAVSPTECSMPTLLFQAPPSLIDDVLALDCVTSAIDAKEGVYVPSRFMSMENRPQYPSFSRPVFIQSLNAIDQAGVANAEVLYNSAQFNIGASGVKCSVSSTKYYAPLQITGAFFTGLNSTAALTLKVKTIVEQFPASAEDNNDFMSPSAAYDPVALDMYEDAISRLPPGCKQTDNPNGEFWGGVVSILSDIIGIIPGFEWVPLVGNIAGPAIGGIVDYFDNSGKASAGTPTPVVTARDQSLDATRGAQRNSANISFPYNGKL